MNYPNSDFCPAPESFPMRKTDFFGEEEKLTHFAQQHRRASISSHRQETALPGQTGNNANDPGNRERFTTEPV